MLCVMRWIALILCLLTPSWVAADSLQDLLDTLNGKVIEFSGKVMFFISGKPKMLLMNTRSVHDFEYSISPSKLRAVKKACAKGLGDSSCTMSGKAEIDTSSGKIVLYITEVSAVERLIK